MDEDFEVRAVSKRRRGASPCCLRSSPISSSPTVHMPGRQRPMKLWPQVQAACGPSVPVLLLVGDPSSPFDENEGPGGGGPDSFLKKPFDSQELLQRGAGADGGLSEQAPAARAAASAGHHRAGFAGPLWTFRPWSSLPIHRDPSPEPVWGNFDPRTPRRRPLPAAGARAV